MSSMEKYRQGSVTGFLHNPSEHSSSPLEHSSSMVLTHGAGLNCQSPLLIAIADALCSAGILVLRCNLRFRDKRSTGPPTPAGAADDRAGLREALMQLQSFSNKPLLLGGHSYGARQSTILMTEPEPPPVSALFLLSYPFHPPRKPEQLRTAHFPALHTPSLFIHGTRDAFGSPDEVRQAMTLLPSSTLSRLAFIEKGGHELSSGKASVPSFCTLELKNFLSDLSSSDSNDKDRL